MRAWEQSYKALAGGILRRPSARAPPAAPPTSPGQMRAGREGRRCEPRAPARTRARRRPRYSKSRRAPRPAGAGTHVMGRSHSEHLVSGAGEAPPSGFGLVSGARTLRVPAGPGPLSVPGIEEPVTTATEVDEKRERTPRRIQRRRHRLPAATADGRGRLVSEGGTAGSESARRLVAVRRGGAGGAGGARAASRRGRTPLHLRLEYLHDESTTLRTNVLSGSQLRLGRGLGGGEAGGGGGGGGARRRVELRRSLLWGTQSHAVTHGLGVVFTGHAEMRERERQKGEGLEGEEQWRERKENNKRRARRESPERAFEGAVGLAEKHKS